MEFESILYPDGSEFIQESTTSPDYFPDLNLDQVVDQITLGKEVYDLKPFFYNQLRTLDEIQYRQEVFSDLENQDLLHCLRTFAGRISQMRQHLEKVNNLYYPYHQKGWFLEAITEYLNAVNHLSDDLQVFKFQSRGLASFYRYITQYRKSNEFIALLNEVDQLKSELSSIHYCVIIKNDLVRVRKYQDEINYSDEIEEFFSKFKQGDVANYLVDLKFKGGMNHIEANILDCVVKLYPEVFTELDQFCIKYSDFADQRIIRFDREIQFYISYIAFISDLKENGLKFCFPRVMKQKKNIFAYDAFDIALVKKLLNDDQTIVCNDFQLRDKERIFVITGPNQGGKTTFARMFGQMHLLASLGCPVPGGKAQLFLFDRIFTHFEREEDIRNLRGKLKDDLVRIQNVLDHATSHSIIIINEIFTSTSLQDAILLGKRILEKIILIDALSVCVTFIDELTELGEQTVSLMSTVFPENPLLRTFKIIRKPADGLSYAHSIAEKHRLTYDEIIGRIGQ